MLKVVQRLQQWNLPRPRLPVGREGVSFVHGSVVDAFNVSDYSVSVTQKQADIAIFWNTDAEYRTDL